MKILYKIKCEYLLFATMVFALSKASKRVLKSMKQTAPLSNFGKETGGCVKGTLSCYLDPLSYDRNEGFVILNYKGFTSDRAGWVRPSRMPRRLCRRV